MSENEIEKDLKKKTSISERAEYLKNCVISSNYHSDDVIRIPPGLGLLNFDNYGPRQQFYSKALARNEGLKKKFIDDPDHLKRYSAGILPFYLKNKSVYFLLGRDTPRDNVSHWSDFGGRSESADNGRWDVTAAREFYEETIGSVMDIATIMSKLANKKNYLKIKSTTLNGSPYYMYLVKVPYKDYRQTFQSTLSFIKYMTKSIKLEYKYFEKTDIQWISLDTLTESIKITDNSEIYQLRPVFKKTLFDNLELVQEFCSQFYNSNIFVE